VKRVLILAAALAALSLAASAEAGTAMRTENEVESLPLHLHLAGLKRAAPPAAFEDRMVFSVEGPYRFVGAAFEHEGFALIHPFARNKQGVFVLAYPIPLKRREPLVYRLVADGAWMSDGLNPRRAYQAAGGLELSVVEVPYLSDLHLGLYAILGPDGRTARFLFRGAPGELVTVCGDFDNWDPFIHELAETSPGTYELALPLPPGIHHYAFVYRGEYLPDPLNPEKALSGDGRLVSVLVSGG